MNIFLERDLAELLVKLLVYISALVWNTPTVLEIVASFPVNSQPNICRFLLTYIRIADPSYALLFLKWVELMVKLDSAALTAPPSIAVLEMKEQSSISTSD